VRSLRDEERKPGEEVLGYPPPGCFGKRGCKLLKIKEGGCNRRGKRLQEIDRSRVRAGATVGQESFRRGCLKIWVGTGATMRKGSAGVYWK